MPRRLLVLACATTLLSACPQKEAPKPDASTTGGAQQGASLSECDQLGVAMRALAFQRAARKVESRPWTNDPASRKCRADWAQRLYTVAANFRMEVDCKADETQRLLELFRQTPDRARADLTRFPDLPPDGVGEAPEMRAFHDATNDAVNASADEVIRRAQSIGDGGCPY